MGLTIERIEIFLLVAALVAMLARRLHVPYNIGLVLAGIALAFLPLSPNVELTKGLIFSVFLPPLIFEAAIQLPWQKLRKDLPVIFTFATVGVLLAAATTATGMHYLAGWSWIAAAVFGLLIAATDPVSVIATFKEANIRGRIRLLVEAESLFNDGTAAVCFSMAIAIVSGGETGAFAISKMLMLMFAGSILCGAAVAGVVILLAGATEDHLIEITFTTIAAFGSFLLAEHFHMSGILSTLTAGLIIGNAGHLAISPRGREVVEVFWEYAAFVANSLIFLFIGMRLAHGNYSYVWLPALIAIVVVTLGRALTIYPLSLIFARTSLRMRMDHQHILFWGGLRGALALALALGLPPETPQRQAIVSVAFAVVAFSIIVQGLTIKPLMRRVKEE